MKTCSILQVYAIVHKIYLFIIFNEFFNRSLTTFLFVYQHSSNGKIFFGQTYPKLDP